MKKLILFCSFIALCGCSSTTSINNDFTLTELTSESNNCEFLYTIKSKASVYNEEDAKEYLRDTIHSQDTFGDSYFITSKEITKNEDAIFGPKNTYSFKANVYKCLK